jgi:hypothetical protein
MVFSAFIGYLAFSEIPDRRTWIGSTIIAGAAIYIARRESQLVRRAGDLRETIGNAFKPRRLARSRFALLEWVYIPRSGGGVRSRSSCRRTTEGIDFCSGRAGGMS